MLSGGRGSHQFQLQAEVEGAPEAAGEAAVQRRNHRPGGGVQPVPHPHQRGERSPQRFDGIDRIISFPGPDARRLAQTVAENGSPEVDGPSAPTAAPVDPPALGLSHCRGGQPHRHHKRGGRARPQHRRGPPITQHLNQLRLSSEQPETAKAQGSHAPPTPAGAGLCPSKADGGLSAEQQEPPAALSPDSPPASQGAPEGPCPGGAADGRRQRRRGSRRPVANSGAPGPPHHWDARASRNRGGYSRDGGGLRRGHSRAFQHKVVDREQGREEVL